ncbi:hypothetical protein DH2020_028105 [Rehmannia glutinosa]|uniref:BHLH domain-containing protein n=1 Tax=Rehmannia glutinosa TaxID=99300 RepID=A0ABR0VVY7_REHGL
MDSKSMIAGNLDPERKRSGGLRTKQAGRGSCRGKALKTLCGVNQWSYAVFGRLVAKTQRISGNGNVEIDLLVNKMMMDNHVNVVGEGLVGRVAFTGNYQWILCENYYREAHPAEVLKDICQQFAAGMQTVTVIPVLPHGVVQFGSHLKIAENIGFVNEVVSLVLQLGHIPGVLQSENYTPTKLAPNVVNASSFSADSFNNVGCSQTSTFDSQISFALSGEIRNEMQSRDEAKIARALKMDFSSQNQFINGAAKAEVIIPSNSDLWMNQQSSPHMRRSVKDSNRGSIREQNIFSDNCNQGHFINPVNNINYDDPCNQPCQSGDDLFDVLGADFKNKLFGSSRLRNESATNTRNRENINSPSEKSLISSEMYSSSQVNSDSGILSFTSNDHLLDAVISTVHLSVKESLDDNISCRTTLADMSSSSASKGELLGIPKYLAKAGSTIEDSRTYSQGSTIYDSWSKKGHNTKQNNIVATGSNKPRETSKTNRKRLKPGENPRPRPKDRQMIQDRVKELREIVPNGAKCSIDALLERTIKHMVFLQGVTKHADKLKQTSGSKIISKDGGLVLKDNSGGGATWAYEVGSQSMVCPIIVEDLNQPHQMLVEMLCEERGLFLEIADIIRGLGLTILKGLMEDRSDKIWARFTVEANTNITRMEVFLSLVHLLEQNAKTVAPQPNSNDSMIVQEFHQATAV